MKIAYVITRSDVIGGASIHLLDLAIGAQQVDYEVEVYVGGNGVFVKRAKKLGLNCTTLKNMQREISPWGDFLGFLELRKILKNTQPNLVHLHSSKAGILGRLAAKSLGIPSIFTAHGWAFTEGVSERKKKLYIAIERFMARVSDKIITVSDFDRQLALRSKVGDPDLISSVHNGIPNIIPILRKEAPSSKVKLIMVARFDEPKDYKLLLEAVSQLQRSSWSLELVGDGPLREQAMKYVKDNNLIDYVSFPGACNDVVERLEKADVFLLISNWEGLPLTILEAMRASLPVIASNVGGVSEAVSDGKTGVLVPRGDMTSLVLAIQKLLDNEQLRLSFGKAGREKFEKEFLFDLMLDKTLTIYNQVVYKQL